MSRRCVIFAGLPVPSKLCADISSQDVIIAADAGWKTVRKLGLSPTLTLGEFDSSPAPEQGVVLRLPVQKDDTDTHFAARKALEMQCTEVCILGGIGGRLDHTLANISTLLFLEKHGVRASLRGENAFIRVLLPGEYEFTARENVYVSLFPMEGPVRGLSLRGFQYSLEDAALSAEYPLGVSNEFLEQTGYISFREGTLVYLECDKDR